MPAALCTARSRGSFCDSMMPCTPVTQTYVLAPSAIHVLICSTACGMFVALTRTPRMFMRSVGMTRSYRILGGRLTHRSSQAGNGVDRYNTSPATLPPAEVIADTA